MEREKLDWPVVDVAAAALIGAGIMLNITTSGSVGPGKKVARHRAGWDKKRWGAPSFSKMGFAIFSEGAFYAPLLQTRGCPGGLPYQISADFR